MANAEHVALVRQGADRVAEWRRKRGGAVLDLTDARLNYLNLRRMNLSAANLKGASLVGADLMRADFTEADLTDASLKGADLTWAEFIESEIDGADFGAAEFGKTVLASVDLSGVTGLDLARHSSSSFLNGSTLTRSHGHVSDVFLRGCGLADWEILNARLYDPDLTPAEIVEIHNRAGAARLSKPIQTRPVFISYSHNDTLAVNTIEAGLQGVGIRVWRDIHNATAGRLERIIHDAMEDRVALIVLSESSLASDWVEHEVEHARELEKEQSRDVLCPIALDGAWRAAKWPGRLIGQLKKHNILDFSKWQEPTAFAEAFRKLEAGIRRWY